MAGPGRADRCLRRFVVVGCGGGNVVGWPNRDGSANGPVVTAAQKKDSVISRTPRPAHQGVTVALQTIQRGEES